MPHMTTPEFEQMLADCNFRVPEQVSKLVTSTFTDIHINEKVLEKVYNDVNSPYNLFVGLFGSDVWPDGQGQDEIREYYVPSYLPVSFNHFNRTMQVTDPNLAHECHTDYCDIPEGGRGTLPPLEMYKWGFKTPRDCIANIRHLKQFQFWARKVIQDRENADKQIMEYFYTFAVLRLLGHKYVLQGERNAQGNLVPIPNNNPRNAFRAFAYNFLEPLFPAVTAPEDIMPLTIEILQILARYKSNFGNGADAVAMGPRGEYIWEFWIGDDFFGQEFIRNPDYMKSIMYNMPNTMFAGYTLRPGSREIIQNWAPRIVQGMPRFTVGTEGGLVPVDTREGIDIEVGKEWVGSREFESAPFGLAMIVSGKLGTIMKRPALTQSGAGFPILPITGDGNWIVRNDYDKDCNPDLNQPYSQKRYELGFRLDNPDAGTGMIYRRRVFTLTPVNECDLAPLLPPKDCPDACEITTVGCQDNLRAASCVITEPPSDIDYVLATGAACGNTTSAPFMYRIQVERKTNKKDFAQLDCPCGSEVQLYIFGDDGVYKRQLVGTVVDDTYAYPYGILFVTTTVALTAGQCIKGIQCHDDSPIGGKVLVVEPTGTPNQYKVVLDSTIPCEPGQSASVMVNDSEGSLVDAAAATINSVNHVQQVYVFTATGLDPVPPGGYMELICTGATVLASSLGVGAKKTKAEKEADEQAHNKAVKEAKDESKDKE